MKLRKCKLCKKYKGLSSFYARKSGKNAGWVFKECKKCSREIGKRYYLLNLDKEKERMKRYKRSGGFAKAMARWRERHPESKKKRAIRDAVKYKIMMNEIIRGSCKICGSHNNIEAHHPNYNKPFEIEWYCKKHHMIIEGRLIYLS